MLFYPHILASSLLYSHFLLFSTLSCFLVVFFFFILLPLFLLTFPALLYKPSLLYLLILYLFYISTFLLSFIIFTLKTNYPQTLFFVPKLIEIEKNRDKLRSEDGLNCGVTIWQENLSQLGCSWWMHSNNIPQDGSVSKFVKLV